MDLINLLNSIGININLENLDENIINDIANLFSNLKKENKENEFVNKNFHLFENNSNTKKDENLEKSIANENSFGGKAFTNEIYKGKHFFYFTLIN